MAVASRVMAEPAKVTGPVVWNVALAKGTPTRPVLEAKAAPSKEASNHRVPLPSCAVPAVGDGWPPAVRT